MAEKCKWKNGHLYYCQPMKSHGFGVGGSDNLGFDILTVRAIIKHSKRQFRGVGKKVNVTFIMFSFCPFCGVNITPPILGGKKNGIVQKTSCRAHP
jgi:hypothetical protein